MIVIRASSTDRVQDCAGSLVPLDHPYNPSSDPARSGDALHEVMAQHVSEGGADVEKDEEQGEDVGGPLKWILP